MVNADSTGAHPKGTISGIKHSVATRYGICTAFVGTLSCYPPDRPKLSKYGTIGYPMASWMQATDTVRHLFTLVDGTNTSSSQQKILRDRQILTEYIIGGTQDLLPLLTPMFKFKHLIEARDMYLTHKCSPRHKVYNKDDSLMPLNIVKTVFRHLNEMDYISDTREYVVIYSAIPPNQRLIESVNYNLLDTSPEYPSDDNNNNNPPNNNDINVADNDDDEREYQYNQDMNARIKHHTITDTDILKYNNIKFSIQIMGYGKEFISGGSGYPPYLNPNKSVTVDSGPAQGESTELSPKVTYINEDDEVFNFDNLI